jgi:uncharacterized protein (TIGR03435 family)
MKPTEDSLKTLIDRHLPTPSPLELTASRERLLNELRSMPAHRQRPRVGDAAPSVSWWRPAASLAAAAALIAIIATASFQRGDWIATVEAADGSRYTIDANEVLRLSDGDAMLTLEDGSRVEMRSEAELSLEREVEGLGIHLRSGDIIVNAAKQRSGRLHVRTKDMTVAVAGTVFLVNAATDGSRVAVIEGEVAVRERGMPLRHSGRQGAIETTLKPGEQVATSPTLAGRSMREDLTWSRHAAGHLAILDSFTRGMAQTAGRLQPLANAAQTPGAAAGQARAEFEEASVRVCDPDNLPPLPEGARGGGANSFYMTPGRTYALCMTPATLVRTAYGYGPFDLDYLRPPGTRGFGPDGRGLSLNGVYGLGVEDGKRVRGGPDWVRSERYTIEAVANGTADAETMRGPMLQALLESRFKLKAHVETEQAPAFSLVVAPGGLRIKPAESGACEPMPPPDVPAVRIPRGFAAVRGGEKPSCGFSNQPNGPNNVIVGGELTLATLAQWLGDPLGRVPVADRTGVTQKFNFVLEFVWDENTPGRRRVVPQDGGTSDVPRAPSIFAALEEQLGLRLQPARAPREYIVIDAIERPSPN